MLILTMPTPIRIRHTLNHSLPIIAIAMLISSCAHKGPAQPSSDQTAPTTASTTTPTYTLGQPRIVLRWQTETESNTFGYFVYRAESPGAEFVCINAQNPVHAVGTSTMPLKYAYFDLSVTMGKTYYYKLQSRDLDDTTEWIIGGDQPVEGTAKPITQAELDEILAKGPAYREEAN